MDSEDIVYKLLDLLECSDHTNLSQVRNAEFLRLLKRPTFIDVQNKTLAVIMPYEHYMAFQKTMDRIREALRKMEGYKQ